MKSSNPLSSAPGATQSRIVDELIPNACLWNVGIDGPNYLNKIKSDMRSDEKCKLDPENYGDVIRYFLEKGYEVRTHDKLVINVVGLHGFGKTDIGRIMKKYVNVKTVEPAQWSEAAEFNGWPDVTTTEQGVKVVEYIMNKMFPVAGDEAPGVLVLDDYNRAQPNIINALMQVIQKQRIMACEFPKGWTIMLTSNPENAGYDVTPSDSAQITRMSTWEIKYDHEAWIDWAIDNGVDNRLVRFMSTNGSLVFNPKNDANKNEMTVPRSLKNASNMLVWYDTTKPVQSNMTKEEFKEAEKAWSENVLMCTDIMRSNVDDVVAEAFADFLRKDSKPMVTAKQVFGEPGKKGAELKKTFDEAIAKVKSYVWSKTDKGEKTDNAYKSLFFVNCLMYIADNYLTMSMEQFEMATKLIIFKFDPTPKYDPDGKLMSNVDKDLLQRLTTFIAKHESLRNHVVRNPKSGLAKLLDSKIS